MDPDAVLMLIRQRIEQWLEVDDANDFSEQSVMVGELVDALQALDRWLTTGGFLPKDWQQ